MQIREYQVGDEAKITELFLIAETRHIKTIDYWLWSNNLKDGLSMVVEDNNKIIGHYSIIPKKIKIAGEILKGGFAQQAVIHPRYRNLKILIDLTEKVWEKSKDRYDFIFGFPNDNIWKICQIFMDWQKIDKFYADILNVNNTINYFKQSQSKENSVKRVYSFPHGMDSWLPINKIRDLNWRFISHPLNYYFIFIAFDNNYPVGYMVVKLYHNGKKSIGHFIDYDIKDNRSNYMFALIKEATLFLDNCYINEIVFWNKKNESKEIFELFGIQKGAFKTNLGVKFLNKPDSKLLDKSNWSYTMALSDAF